MKCRLQCLLFALMLGQAFSTGGVHDKYSVEMKTGIGAGDGGGGNVGTAANAGAVTAKTGTSLSTGGGSVGTAANAGTATASTASGAPDITDLNSILGSLLTSAGSSAAAAGSASATTSVTSNPSNPQSPTTSSLFNKFGGASNPQNPTAFTSSLFDKFGAAGAGGWPIVQLFQPNPLPKMVTTVYNTNNNARFSHGLPQFYPYVYKQYYDPYPGHYVLPLF